MGGWRAKQRRASHQTDPRLAEPIFITASWQQQSRQRLNAALREGLFAVNTARLGLGAGVIVYNLLTEDSLDLPYLTSAGFAPRTTGIAVGGCLADEWVCAFGEHGIAGWAADALGGDEPAHPLRIPHPRTTTNSPPAPQ